MNIQSSQAGPELVHAISQIQDSDTLLHTFQEFLNTLTGPYAELELLVSTLNEGSSPAQNAAIRLLEAELLLYFSQGPIDAARVENIFKQLTFLSITNSQSSGSLKTITRIKYNDLFMDYQFLLAPKVKAMRLVDAVTKKINLLALLPLHSPPNSVVAHMRQKILVYYLLCDSDYRTKGVLKYLYEEGVFASVSPEVSSFLERREKLTSIHEYEGLVHHLKQVFYPLHVLEKRHGKQLLENHLDRNLSKLPRYYTSISLSRIESLLFGPEQKGYIEEVLYKMIAAQKFPHGASIDQISGYVYFCEKTPKYTDFDAHVKKVCDTVDVISAAIRALLLQENA